MAPPAPREIHGPLASTRVPTIRPLLIRSRTSIASGWTRFGVIFSGSFSGPSLGRSSEKIAERGHGMKTLIGVVAVAALFDLAVATGPDATWWPDFGGNAANSHFVDLDQINKSNVGQLEVAWFYPYGQT